MCKKVSKFIFYVFKFFIFINNQGKHRKMLNTLNIRCYSYQVKKQFYPMNGVCVSTVIVIAKRAAPVDRVGVRSFLAYLFVIDK